MGNHLWGLAELIVHLFEFQVLPGHEAEVAGSLAQTGPARRPSSGDLMHCAGSRLSRHQQEHIAVTCWPDHETFVGGTDRLGVPSYLSAKASLLTARRSMAFTVVSSIGATSDGARILRVYTAQVAAASLEEWGRREAEQLVELERMKGMVCARAGVGLGVADADGELPIVAISAWRDWEAVLAATGGHIDRLILTTELDDLERPGGLVHYDLIEFDERGSGEDHRAEDSGPAT